MNVGTIVEMPMLKVRLGRGRVLGEVEEYFVQGLVPGDTFIFAGQHAALRGHPRDGRRLVSRAAGGDPKVPAYAGGRLPLTTHLAGARARASWPSPGAGMRCRTTCANG